MCYYDWFSSAVTEPRASCVPGKHSTDWTPTPALSHSVYYPKRYTNYPAGYFTQGSRRDSDKWFWWLFDNFKSKLKMLCSVSMHLSPVYWVWPQALATVTSLQWWIRASNEYLTKATSRRKMSGLRIHWTLKGKSLSKRAGGKDPNCQSQSKQRWSSALTGTSLSPPDAGNKEEEDGKKGRAGGQGDLLQRDASWPRLTSPFHLWTHYSCGCLRPS